MSAPRGFRSIIFDCDSTLSAIEGIDELAGSRLGEIRALTDAAMAGAVPLEEVYGYRLDIVQPTRARVEALGQQYIACLVEDARETIAALLWLGKSVRVISGGLRPPVVTVATALGLGPDDVAAVGIEFDADGSYAGYERTSPLARSGGKGSILRGWGLERPSLLVGDGATDLEARPEVDAFAAYMGVAHRQAVADQADVVLRLRHSEWAKLLARGDELLGETPRPGDAG
jgi:phosphoserine phosphatase